MSDRGHTKDRLIRAARDIFAEKGYKDASVREIAKKADANLNAINYHFENKRKLYVAVVAASKRDFSNRVSELIVPEIPPLSEFIVRFYKLFRESGSEFLNNIKIHLDQTFSFEELHDAMCKQQSCEAGPPGLTTLIRVLDREYGDKIPTRAKIWIARSASIQVFHLAILFVREGSEDFVQKHLPKEFFFCPEESLVMTTRALVEYSINNPSEFATKE